MVRLEVCLTGTIVLQTGESQCEYGKFDYEGGRMIIGSIRNCNYAGSRDQHGVLVRFVAEIEEKFDDSRLFGRWRSAIQK